MIRSAVAGILFLTSLDSTNKYKMAFICPGKEESDKKAKLACKLKKLLKELEDDHKIEVNPVYVKCCMPMCHVPEPPHPCKKCPNKKLETPQVMVCYKLPPKKKGHHTCHCCSKNANQDGKPTRLKQSTSRELRCGILYRGCDCEKRFGLQDQCRRTGCHGSPECLTNPPICGPSEFCDGKHLVKKAMMFAMRRQGKSGGQKQGKDCCKCGGRKEKPRYKCFPAVIKDPVCCGPCAPCCAS